MLWWPSTCLISVPRPAFPAQVASGSFPSAFFNTHNSQRLASKVLVDLLVHSPSSVGAASKGTLCNESQGLLTNLATFANSIAQGVLPTPQAGATKGIERPCLWTSLAVLWLRVLYSRYPAIFPSTSTMSDANP